MIWRGQEKMASYASPVLATVHGKRVAFCLMRQGLVALDPKPVRNTSSAGSARASMNR